MELGDLKVIAKTYGSAHSPGDVTVLVPQDRVVLAGNMAFHIRMPPIFGDTDTALGSIASIILWTRSPIGLSYPGMVG